MNYLAQKTHDFRKKLVENFTREELLEIISKQEDGDNLIAGINRIEYVFANKLQHLNWPDGTPILGRDLTMEELALLVDEPFQVDEKLTELGLSIDEQREVHIAKDPVVWSRNFLLVNPRVYQILMLRNPSLRKVLRAGRRLGKTYTMSIMLLHWAYTHNDARCIVVAPMKAQVEVIFKEMLKLASNSEPINDAITRKVTSPNFTIEMTNGSTIKFFTSGLKSGGKADVVRGQEAHIIVLDELDYMHPDDLIALLAMLQKTEENQDDKVLVGASTPTGAHSTFYDWCMNTDGLNLFKEFWFPSYVNPNFSAETEAELRAQYRSEMSYRHEVEADWGEDTEGVYPRKYIDAAFVGDWEYKASINANSETYNRDSVYVMGVDWDKYGAGTNIVVLEYCLKHPDQLLRNRIRLAFRSEVPRDEYTLTNAVREIIRLNAIFNPAYIYVDRGYGEMQVETLKKHGIEHPNTGLEKKVRGVSFSETIEVRDPFNPAKKDKKEIKPFMISTLREILETGKLIIPKADAELRMSLMAYVVERTTSVGRPVFGMNTDKFGDHSHDALILACHAISEHYSDFLKQRLGRTLKTMSADPFDQLQTLPGTQGAYEKAKEKIETEYGSISNAPIKVNRTIPIGKLRSANGLIRRKSF